MHQWLISFMLVLLWSFGFTQVNEPPPGSLAGKTFSAQGSINNSRGIAASLNESFEGETFPPAGWTVINGGGPGTWERSTEHPHTGNACAKINFNSVAHNDWLITPGLIPAPGNATFSFYARNGAEYLLERFNVKLSTTGTNEADFTVTLASNVEPPPYVYTNYTYDLSAYNGQTVYVAIQAISQDLLYFNIDDVTGPNIGSSGPLPEPVTNISPVNGAQNIENGESLTWSFGANTSEYEVLLGTTNPPVTVVVPFTGNLATSYLLSNLQTNTNYYWQVNVRNVEGTVPGPIWSFTSAQDVLYTSVDVTVTLNSGGSPLGTTVTFTNTSEPGLGLVYTETLGLSGQFTWPEFRKGTYTINVVKAGYAPINLTGVAINAATSFTWELTELLTAPVDLYVTPTGLATWDAGAAIQFEPFAESFNGLENGTLPAGWTKSPETDNWGVFNTDNAGGSSPEMRFNFLPYGNDTYYLKTPVFTTIGQTLLQLSFKNYLNDYQSGYSIKVIAIADGVEHIIQVWDSPSSMPAATLTYDLTAAHGVGATEFQLAWVFTGSSSQLNRWCIDDILLKSAGRSPKAFVSYKVYHQGAVVANVAHDHYQFGTNGETLVEGQTYLAEVSANYSTGESSKISYNWTYKACGSYPVPGNFTAAQVAGTLNTALSWTKPTIPVGQDQIDFARITRDGVVLAETEGTSYLDPDLNVGTYNYCITFVYESGAETCPGTLCQSVTIVNNGLVNGNVKQATYMGGANIEGATVTLTNSANPSEKFTFVTDASGNYVGDVPAATYHYVVAATGYLSQTLENITITQTATVTHNFVLHEIPYPAVNVTATEQNPGEVKVDWLLNTGVLGEWLFYDDGIYTDAVGGPGTFSWAIKFDPEQLIDYAGSSLTKISLYNLTADENTLIICEGPNAQTPLYEQQLSGLPYGEWAEVLLDTPVAINVNKELWITIYTTAGVNHPAAAGASQNEPNGDLLSLDGITWEHIPDVLSLPLTWNLRGFVTDMRTNEMVELTPGPKTPIYEPSAVNTSFEFRKNEDASANANINTNAGNREIQGFNVYRTSCVTGDLQLLGTTTEIEFTDNTWGAAEPGAYKWGVEALYPEQNAEIKFSNCLDKDMITQVSVTVTTLNGDSPEGTHVVFVNTSEPGALGYEVELDESGYYLWDDFRKGTYDIHVEKAGFGPIDISEHLIDAPEDFVWELEELILPVVDLSVSPTGLATWRDGAPVVFEPFIEDFSNGIDHWTRYPATNNWQWSQTNLAGGASAPEVRFYWSPNSIDRFYFISPEINTFAQTELEISFQHAVNEVLYGESYKIQLITMVGNVERLVMEFDDNNLPPTQVITTLTAEHGVGAENLRIAFVYEGNAYYMNWWNIDDIAITAPQTDSRELQTYKVWLDGVLIDDTQNTHYQYDQSTLVEGQQYYTEIEAQYTSGLSEKMGYTWTYVSCDNYAGPTELDYEVVNLNDVVLNWSGNAPTIGDFYEGFESGTLPEGWVVYDVDNDGYNWENTKIQFPDFEPHSGLYCMTSASYVNEYGAVTPNNFLVTPPIRVTLNSQLKFWVAAQDPLYPREWYRVKISTTGNAVEDFTTTLREAWSRMDWAEVIIDLSPYDGQTIYIAFEHMTPQGLDMFYIKMDDVTVTNTYTQATYTAPVASASAESIPFRTDNMTSDEIETKFDNLRALAAQHPKENTDYEHLAAVRSELLGTNIYRDGILIAEKVFGQTYTDPDVEAGIYEYCINYVYTGNAMPCTPLCVSDVTITGEDCVAPYNLTAAYSTLSGEVSLAWNHDAFEGTYLSYGESVYASAFGLIDASPFTVAIQFDPEMLAPYHGKSFSKINFFYGFGSIGEVVVQIWEGQTLILEEEVTGTIEGESWNEIELNNPVQIDATKSYKVGYTVSDYDGYPVGVQYYDGIPNSDLFLLDGMWDHMSNYEPYAWLLQAYVSNPRSAGGIPIPLTGNKMNQTGNSLPVKAPFVNLNRGQQGRSSRALRGYNIYKEGELLQSVWPEKSYVYEEVETGTICYSVTAVYDYCGETAHSDEDCVLIVNTENPALSGVRVYPNPSNSKVNIEFSDNITHIAIYNILGKVVLESNVSDQNMLSIDVTKYQPGTYLLKLTTKEGINETRKMMISN